MTDKNSIAVFIDGDNISPYDIPLIIEEIKTHGNIIYNSLFCDMSDPNMINRQNICTDNGVSLIHCERITGKNSTDIKLIVELMNILYTNNLITLFYIITSDSDYRHVIPCIREKGKLIYCIGNKQTNNALQKICNKFTYIEILKKKQKPEPEPESNENYVPFEVQEAIATVKLKEHLASTDPEPDQEPDPEPDPAIEDNIIKYKKEIMNLFQTDDVVNIGNIMISLQDKYNFDFREYGYDRMKPFLKDNYPELHYLKDGCVSLEKI